MKIVIRTDASSTIGSGHVMRCLSLAQILREQGDQVEFLCRAHIGHLNQVIVDAGFVVHVLDVSVSFEADPDLLHSKWLGATQAADATQSISRIGQDTDWLIIDHYALDVTWESILRKHVHQIMVIDDLADRRHDCDVLLDQNYQTDYKQRYDKLTRPGCKLLLGPRYALLRAEFETARKNKNSRNDVVKRIFVFFGGVDSSGETVKVVHAIRSIKNFDVHVDIVIGSGNPRRDELKRLCAPMSNVVLHFHIDNVAEIMSRADLALGAGGTTNWERAALGLPSIVVGIAENQRSIIRALAGRGFILGYEDAELVSSEEWRSILTFAIGQPLLRQFMSSRLAKLVDAKGVFRVVKILHAEKLILREADASDSAKLLVWRNREEVRNASNTNEIISPEKHDRWFGQTMADENKVLLIGEVKGLQIGVLRFDLSGEQALVSIYLTPGMGGNGYGGLLLAAGEKWIRKNKKNVRHIIAEVRPSNVASEKLFTGERYNAEKIIFQKNIT